MITNIHLENFRRFEAFSLRLKSGNILVGPNNSGKSSILDAFRVLESCFRYAKTQNPKWFEIRGKGVFPSYDVPETVFPFSLANATYDYGDVAKLEFKHQNGVTAVVEISTERQNKFYLVGAGPRVVTRLTFFKAFPVNFVVVPTLAPLEAEEKLVENDTVRRNAGNRLASRVLRNIWYRRDEDDFEKFKSDVEGAWPNIEIKKPELDPSYPPVVRMYFSENRRDREVQWAGFGFQVWLQILTHLYRGQKRFVPHYRRTRHLPSS